MQQIYRRTHLPKGDFNKVALQFLIKSDFNMNQQHIFRTPFYKNTSGWLLLSEENSKAKHIHVHYIGMVKKWDQDSGNRDPPQSLKVGPGTPLKFKSGTPGPPSKFKSGTPSPFFNEFIFFRIFHRFFLLIYFCVFFK